MEKGTYLNAILKEVIAEANALNIPVSSRILPRVKINRRAHSRFGSCRKQKRGLSHVFIIEISGHLLDEAEKDEFSDEKIHKIRQTIAHEILHTCRGCADHGDRWKSYAEKMNHAYGYHIKRASTYEEMGMPVPENREEVRYVIVCEKCGARIERRRNSKFVQYPQLYRCRCGGTLRREAVRDSRKAVDEKGADPKAWI